VRAQISGTGADAATPTPPTRMKTAMPDTRTHDPVKIGIVSISDRASSGVYEDKGLPALQGWLTAR
jgi:hypothetical protein